MTGIDRNNPSADDVMAAMLAAEFLTAATTRLVGAGVPREKWPEILMKSFLWLCDMGEQHAGANTPSVRMLLDIAREHLGLPPG